MNKTDLLRESILDTQQTIRAIDVKAGFFLVFLCLPLSEMDKITIGLSKLVELHDFWIFLIILDFLLWVVSLLILVFSVFPLSNPKDSIDFDGYQDHPKGVIFGGYLFPKLEFLSAFNVFHIPKANTKFVDEKKYIDSLDSIKIEDELLFERMKLISIRDIKIKRMQKALLTTIFWVAISFLTWLAVIILN
ncbi:hypothetical protein [Acinetobacter sp. M5A5_2a]